MKNLLVISMIIGVAYGSSLADNVANIYKSLTGSSSHGSGGYQDDYGGKNCYPTYETKYKEQCEDYHEKVCYTSHKESCEDVQGKKSLRNNARTTMRRFAIHPIRKVARTFKERKVQGTM